MRPAATQRGEGFLQRHVTSATPIEAIVPRHNFAIIASRHHTTGSLSHPGLDRAPSIFDVIGGEPIGIDDLTGAMVDHLMS